MEGIELISFKIISTVGTARSNYIEAVKEASKGNFEKAEQLIAEGREVFTQGHLAHADLLQEDADGKHPEFSMLLMHAEDQLMSAEAFGILAVQFIDVYKQLKKED